ncbi:MAG: hypothetical protein A3A24_01105 [Candidatus Buchananbacteria bacterium RIFCSPLOWO2_01_FULL_46_12]|uniref:Uncharacterized protein n=2 Tax=Candidatus Buchananiibacteriota TaxID=1817903 RepID=A0A1G1YRT0_9BACT|nr:MAG: hypothetical protein A2744_00315 [Candidatus Buchananbacteria bacterium RIFCSPHIGHO2_01_FULL_44_11]OGY55062.1 MAG: hypothetical protein A3A24_01105 [Candidatus Buchananbacteria bacterium RIFCSPLOWO2_01_FULL_46_12]
MFKLRILAAIIGFVAMCVMVILSPNLPTIEKVFILVYLTLFMIIAIPLAIVLQIKRDKERYRLEQVTWWQQEEQRRILAEQAQAQQAAIQAERDRKQREAQELENRLWANAADCPGCGVRHKQGDYCPACHRCYALCIKSKCPGCGVCHSCIVRQGRDYCRSYSCLRCDNCTSGIGQEGCNHCYDPSTAWS